MDIHTSFINDPYEQSVRRISFSIVPQLGPAEHVFLS